MTTQHPRIQVTINKETSELLSAMAHHKAQSISSTAAELIREALEIHEDAYFSKIADDRVANDDGERFTHEEAWSNA